MEAYDPLSFFMLKTTNRPTLIFFDISILLCGNCVISVACRQQPLGAKRQLIGMTELIDEHEG